MQDSTGMKLWKKRWFVLSDLCLFYYRGKLNTGNQGKNNYLIMINLANLTFFLPFPWLQLHV